MCGILGAISNKKDIDPLIIKALFIANESRGNQSAGYATRKGNNIEIVKKAISPIQFSNDLGLDFLKGSDLIIGHTRLATTGAITDKNSHPFRMGKIVGTHNGVVYGYKDWGKYDVDSQAIFDLIDQFGEEGLEEISGSASIAYIKDDNDSLHLISHSNPLTVAKVGNAIYYSSEFYHLASVLTASGKHAIDYIEELKEDTLYTISSDLKVEETPVKFKSYQYTYGAKKDDKKDIFDDDWAKDKDCLPAYCKNHQYIDPDVELDFISSDEKEMIYRDIAMAEGCVFCGINPDTGYLSEDESYIWCEDCAGQYENIDDMTFIETVLSESVVKTNKSKQ